MTIEDFPEAKWRSRDNKPNNWAKVAIVSSSGKVRVGTYFLTQQVYVRKDLTIGWDNVVAWIPAKEIKLNLEVLMPHHEFYWFFREV